MFCEFKQDGSGFRIKTRPYTETDLGAVAALFTASVHELGAPHYSAVQREAWAPRPPDLGAWAIRLAELKTLLLFDESGLLGFIAYGDSGHIDLLFTSPKAERRGVASSLFQQLERDLPGIELFTEASLVAKPFFLRHGFCVTEMQQVVRGGVAFQRFAMRKAVAR